MSEVDINYQHILKHILSEGKEINTRNSKTMRSITMVARFNKTPLVSVRNTAWKLALREMEWFLSGSNNINDLHSSVRHWWEPWASEEGYVYNNYGKQFRDFAGHAPEGGVRNNDSTDQIQYMIDNIKNDPYSRRNVITTWHTHDMVSPKTPITNCHGSLIMAAVNPSGELDLTMVQRSADMILGVPHNWIQYYAFILWLCSQTGLKSGVFNWVGHDCHIYEPHLEIAQKIVDTKIDNITTPELTYEGSGDFKANDFKLTEYKPIIKEKVEMIV